MLVHSIHEANYTPSPEGVKFARLYASENLVVAHIILAPHQTLAAHKVPGDACLFILEGTPDITLGTEKRTCSAGQLIESPKNIEKILANPTNAPARIMVIREM